MSKYDKWMQDVVSCLSFRYPDVNFRYETEYDLKTQKMLLYLHFDNNLMVHSCTVGNGNISKIRKRFIKTYENYLKNCDWIDTRKVEITGNEEAEKKINNALKDYDYS